MKKIIVLVTLAALFAGCGNGNDNQIDNSKQTVDFTNSTAVTSIPKTTAKTKNTIAITTAEKNITKKSISTTYKPDIKKAKQPQIHIPKQVEICSIDKTPRIYFNKKDRNCDIYYTVDDDSNPAFLKYKNFVKVDRFSKNEVLLGFKLKAYSVKKGFENSKMIEQEFVFESTSDSGGDCIVCNALPKAGDTTLSGKIKENKTTEKMRKNVVLAVTRNNKTVKYEAKVKSGEFVFNLDTAFESGDRLLLTSEFKDKAVHYYKDKKSTIHIWEEYFSFYCGNPPDVL